MIPANGYAAIFQDAKGNKFYRPVHAWNEDGHPMFITEQGLKNAYITGGFLYLREYDPSSMTQPSPYPLGFAWRINDKHPGSAW